MRLIHKLKQVAEMDDEQRRELQSHSSPKTEDEESGEENLSRTTELSHTSQTTVKTTPQRAVSPPRRPLTRSQSGYVSKRRLLDDTPPPPTLTSPSASRKRPRAESSRKPSVEDPEQTDDETTSEPVASTPATPRASSDGPAQSPPPSTSAPLTFLNGHGNGAGESNILRRNPRSRVVLPVPVPNLTKKSRGRRVPIKNALDNGSSERRLYVCSVEGCGKCFLRGEHLKRHIRSIHTHDKPFKCTFSQCEKMFNRHDNLLQHLKVHREPVDQTNAPASSPPNDLESEGDMDPSHECESEDDDQPNVPDTSRNNTLLNLPSMNSSLRFPSPYRPKESLVYPTVLYTSTTRYGGVPIIPSESSGFSTNMAISSMRTEIPSSPRLRSVNDPIGG